MYAVNDDASYLQAIREQIVLVLAIAGVALADMLLVDPQLPDDLDLPDLSDTVSDLKAARAERVDAIAAYEELIGDTAEVAHKRSLGGPQ
ncbi:hypothetical protein LCGC14_1346790 [marine sediment metagenome]|uniref:Uncharacterized protein n=1 Tax=marine sediment metagenome TaxID=412755 RepID=A0A0F9MSS2_9ZZZZ